MKMSLAAASAALFLSAGVASAQDITGVWRTETNDDGNWALVEIYACGSLTCGAITESSIPNSPNIGRQIIKDMVYEGDGEWDDGEIYAPDHDEWYDADIELAAGGQLEVSGCVLGGLICRSQTWTRE